MMSRYQLWPVVRYCCVRRAHGCLIVGLLSCLQERMAARLREPDAAIIAAERAAAAKEAAAAEQV